MRLKHLYSQTVAMAEFIVLRNWPGYRFISFSTDRLNVIGYITPGGTRLEGCLVCACQTSEPLPLERLNFAEKVTLREKKSVEKVTLRETFH